MAQKYRARVYEYWNGTGTGDIALAGAPSTEWQTFVQAGYTNGETTDVIIYGAGGFESCSVTYNSGANSLTRGTIKESSNAGSRVNFLAGVKTVLVVVPAKRVETVFGNLTEFYKVSGPTALRTYSFPDSDATITYTGNKLSVFAATTSAELAGVISDETGSGFLVFGTAPAISSPTISGTATITAGANVSGLWNFTSTPTILSTTAGAAAGPQLSSYRNVAVPAANDLIGFSAYYGNNSTPTFYQYAKTQGRITNPGAGIESGNWSVWTSQNNILAERVTIGGGMVLSTATGGDLGAGTLNAGTSVSVNNVLVPTISSSSTLTNKTISGSSNTLSNIALSSLAAQAAFTFVGNNTSGSAAPTAVDIAGLTTKASPAAGDYVWLSDQAASGAWKKATIASVASAGSVASIAGNTGAFTLAGGVTNSTNQIQLDGNYTGFAIANGTLAVSAAASALTIALKDNAGNDPSATSPVFVNFRNVTGTTGSTSLVAVTAATSLVISSGSTLGVTSSTAFRLWVVGFNDGGTFRLGVINCSTTTQVYPLTGAIPASSTAEGGAGAADSAGVIYTGTAVASKAYRILGYLEWSSSGLTAGTWTTTNLLYVQPYGPGVNKPGAVVQTLFMNSVSQTATTSSTYQSSSITKDITPTSAANIVRGYWNGSAAAASAVTTILTLMHRGSSSVGGTSAYTDVGAVGHMSGVFFDTPNTTSTATYCVKFKSVDNATNVIFPYTATGGGGSLMIDEIMG